MKRDILKVKNRRSDNRSMRIIPLPEAATFTCLRGRYFIPGKVTAKDTYEFYISGESGQRGPNPPTFFTPHLERERLSRAKTWLDANTCLG